MAFGCTPLAAEQGEGHIPTGPQSGGWGHYALWAPTLTAVDRNKA